MKLGCEDAGEAKEAHIISSELPCVVDDVKLHHRATLRPPNNSVHFNDLETDQ